MASTPAVSGYAEIVRNTVSGILRSKVLYVILFLTIIIGVLSILPILYFQMASEAGEINAALSLTSQTMGTIIGSNVFNILAIMGVAAAASSRSIDVPQSFPYLDLPVMLAAALVTTGFVWFRKPIGRTAGVIFTSIYVSYITLIFVLS